jgi:Cdc6-like AAA superfamily ATPase
MIEDAPVLRKGVRAERRGSPRSRGERVLDLLTHGESTEPALVSGPSDVGETTITKLVISWLRETVLNVEVIHLNCWQAYSRFKATYEILRELGKSVDICRQSTPHDELLDRLVH